jgi:hypothetical protein
MAPSPKFNVKLDGQEDFVLEATINFTNGGDNLIIAGAAGLIIRVYRFFVVVGGPTNLVYEDGTTALTGPIPLAANEAMVFTFDTKPWFTLSPGNSFQISNSSPGTQVSGRVYYTQT